MAGALVLYIEDKVVGPHLELLRRVCEPESVARPHITVRYSRKLGVPPRYFELEVGEIDLTEPRSFGMELPGPDVRRTIFIGCKADYLKHWEFKPDFKGSEFHITVYNGRSRTFAARLLKILQQIKWNLRVRLPHGTRLKEISLLKKDRSIVETRFSQGAKNLYEQIFRGKLTTRKLDGFTDEERLFAVEEICKHLRKATETFERPEIIPARDWANTTPLSPSDTNVPDVHTGIHITPPELALEIAKYVINLRNASDGKIRFGDPAVGTGAFYSALLEAAPKSSIADAMGIDIDKEQVLIAHRRWSHDRLLVKHGDYLHMDDLPPRNLILANPPYLRNEAIPDPYKEKLLARASTITGMRIMGSAGLYVYFLLLSHAWMSPNALAAWLVPATFLDTDYGEVVRFYLTNKVRLIRIHRYGSETQFENALVNTAVLIFRNETPSPDSSVHISVGGTLENPIESDSVALSTLKPEKRWLLRAPTVNISASDVQLGEVFTVRRGIATGANEFFIMTNSEAAQRGIPEQFVQPILPKIRTIEDPVIERDPKGYPKVQNKLCVINCSLPEEELQRKYKNFFLYLQSADSSIRNRNLVRRRTPWYKQEQRDPAPFLCTYMGRMKGDTPPVKFLWNKSDAIATNNYLMLYPRPRLAEALDKEPERMVELFAILARIPAETMSDSWRVLAEGLHKIEPGALRAVKLPETPSWLLEAREQDLFV
jgi:adenine-specific DNA-methyltransferase